MGQTDQGTVTVAMGRKRSGSVRDCFKSEKITNDPVLQITIERTGHLAVHLKSRWDGSNDAGAGTAWRIEEGSS